jgi:hypothetical protein
VSQISDNDEMFTELTGNDAHTLMAATGSLNSSKLVTKNNGEKTTATMSMISFMI